MTIAVSIRNSYFVQGERMTNRSLKIYLGYADNGDRKVVTALLESLSYELAFTTDSEETLVDRCQKNPPDLVLVGPSMEHDDAFEIVNRLSKAAECAIVAIIQRNDFDRAKRLLSDDLMGILVEPVTQDDLRPAIFLAYKRFEQIRALQHQERRLSEQLKADAEA